MTANSEAERRKAKAILQRINDAYKDGPDAEEEAFRKGLLRKSLRICEPYEADRTENQK